MIKLLLLILIIFPYSLQSQIKINDINVKKKSYNAIQFNIQEGYFNLINNKFRPEKKITREELAIILYEMNKNLESRHLNFDTQSSESLIKLSKTYKPLINKVNENLYDIKKDISAITEKQSMTQNDLSEISNELKKEVKLLKEQNTFLWLGIACAGILGIIL